ncbi:hypothetical protein DEA8626_03336 [Defluviimonas aquaemixtae]|uniref:DUF5681 domain-containing protein n=1 Tax=Albidovulum aquaemixtae TaxID=1542388 RepID=A0A2R8BLN1_9RHOB|nr:DUF5681 domain-containing protein [Defluviimonas aquaemixtae]SPH24286.1 hypothetical protein DEA8626_03336 [Defluviimonas aquaemixtae]
MRPGYDVGYGKPPEGARFKPGQPGNPRGRPKGAKNRRPALHEERMKAIILDEAYRTITVRDGDRNVTVPMARAVIRSLAVNAAKGQHRAQRLFAELLLSTENANRAVHDDWLETAISYKVEWEVELERRTRLGITDLPEPLPHPDHGLIDMAMGTARIVGPSTKEEKAKGDRFVARRADFREEVNELTKMLKAETKPNMRRILSDDIAHAEKIIGIIDGALSGKPVRG